MKDFIDRHVDELHKNGDEDMTECNEETVRQFDTGATRDTDTDKYDYEGFLSPIVLRRYAAYMHENRVQADGQVRDSDNWQKGIPKAAYMKSMWRHFMGVWNDHRTNHIISREAQQDSLCALMFNVMGYLYEELKEEYLDDAVDIDRDATIPGGY